MTDSTQYWLAAPKEEVGPLAMERINKYRDYLRSSGRLYQLRQLNMAYHGVAEDRSSDKLTASGAQGELTKAKLNAQRSMLRNVLTIVTGDQPATFCRAANNDSASMEEAMLGNSIMEDYMKQRNLAPRLISCVEVGLALRKAFLVIDWDFDKGDKVAVEELVSKKGTPYRKILREGDATFVVKNLTQVAFDPWLGTDDAFPWFAVEYMLNKWDLAARFPADPELQQKIIGMGTDWAKRSEFSLLRDDSLHAFPTDMIPVWRVYGAKSAAVEEGRVLLLLEDGTTMFDDPLPFDEIPVIECEPEAELMRRFGYTPGLDCLGLQDAVDGGISAIVTNLLSQAANTIWVKNGGGNITSQDLANGMRVIKSEVKPEAIQLNILPAHSVEVLKLLLSFMEQQVNLNGTARGIPPSANMSGASMALLQSIAVKLSSGIQQSYKTVIEKSANMLFDMLKLFANAERVLDVAGVGNRYVVKRWSNKSISKIRRVVAEIASPLAQTQSGRLEIARDLMKQGEIKTAADYFSVLATGRLDASTSPTAKMISLVEAENEMIARGEKPPVLPTDDPIFHLQHHLAPVADPEARKDPKVVAAYRDHVLEHLENARTMDPLLASILQLQLPPQLIGQPPAGMPAPGGDPNSAEVVDGRPGPEKAAEDVNMPNMPTNPATGEEAQV